MKKIYLLIVAMMAMFSSAPEAVADAVLDLPETVFFDYEGKRYRNGDIVPGNPTSGVFFTEGMTWDDAICFYRVVINDTVVYDFNQVYDDETLDTVKLVYNLIWANWDSDQPITRFSVETTDLASVSTATLTIKADRIVNNLSISLPRSLRSVPDVIGEQEVKFIPGKDYLSIWNAYGDYYCILKNGELINPLTCEHTDIQDGDVIEIVTEIPDKMCHVEIKHMGGASDIINRSFYIIGGITYHLRQDDQQSFDAQAGSQVYWEWNSDKYEVPSQVFVNGEEIWHRWMGDYRIPVDRDNVLIEIKASPKFTTGIDAVEATDDKEAVYYNLQGVRVDNPGSGIYIVVRNGKATKEMIR